MTIEEDIELFIHETRAEIYRAIRLFPHPDGLMTALTEEVGEVAKAVLDETWPNVRKEAVQVAAMAARLAVETDPTLYKVREQRGANICKK